MTIVKGQQLQENLSAPQIVSGATTKEDAKAAKWLLGATSPVADNRPALNCVYVDGPVTVATDGFRLHVTPTPAMLEGHSGEMIYLANAPAAGKPATAQVLDSTQYHYPAYESVVKGAQAQPTAARCYVSGRYLRDFCEGLGDTDMVEITIAENKPATGFNGNGAQPVQFATVVPGNNGETPKRWALIMPMHYDPESSNHPYNPFTRTGGK